MCAASEEKNKNESSKNDTPITSTVTAEVQPKKARKEWELIFLEAETDDWVDLSQQHEKEYTPIKNG